MELTYYFPTQTSGPLAIAMEEIVDAYNAANPDVKVTAVFTGNYADTKQKTLTSLSGGNPPHVVLSNYNLSAYLSVDALIDVKTLIAQEPADFLDDYVEAFWQMFTHGDSFYGVPFQHSGTIMYYNKDILTKAGLSGDAPKTWSELEAAAKAIDGLGESIIPLEFMGDDWITQAMVCCNGGDIFADENTLTLNAPEVIEALDYWKKLMAGNLAVDNKSYGGVAENFLAETTAIMFNSTGSMGNVSNTATFDWDVALMPAGDGKESAAVMGGGGFVLINGHPEEQTQAAWEFVKYMTSPEVTAKWSITSGYFAMRHSAYDLPEMQALFAEKPQYAKTREFLPNLAKPYLVGNLDEVSQVIALALDETLLNNADTQATMDTAQAEAQALIG